MIDTHCHLNHSDFADDLTGALTRARQAGLTAMLVVGYDLPSSLEALALAEAYGELYASVGLHPHSAADLSEGLLRELTRLTAASRVVAVGETGLDFYRDLSPREAQRTAFRELIALAAQSRLPLLVHNRDAAEATLALLAEHAPPELPVLMHCFQGDWDLANECRERGYYLGVAGPVTYPKSDTLREILAGYPGKRLLLETDCPWLAPQTRRGARNEPSYLPEIAAALAAVRGDTLERVVEQTTENARRLFGLPEAAP